MRTETAYRDEYSFPGRINTRPGPINTKNTAYKRNVEVPGLSGPIYLVEARTAAVVGATALKSATAEDVVATMTRLIDGRTEARK